MDMKRTVLFRFSAAGPVERSKESSEQSENAVVFDELHVRNSHFLRSLSPTDSQRTKEHILGERESFNGLLSPREIQSRFVAHIELGEQIRRGDTIEDAADPVVSIDTAAIQPLQDRDKTILLDNLLARLYDPGSVQEVERIEDILKADRFLHLDNEAASTDLRPDRTALMKRVGNAVVVLPVNIINKHQKEPPRNQANPASARLMEDAHKILVAKERTSQVEQAAREWQSHMKHLERRKQTENAPRDTASTADDIIANTASAGELSARTRLILDNLGTEYKDADELSEQLHVLSSEISTDARTQIQSRSTDTAYIAGTLVEEDATIPGGCILVKPEKIGEGLYDVYLSHHCKHPEQRLVGISGSIEQPGSTVSEVTAGTDLMVEREFQLFKLNEQPVPGEHLTLSLTVTTADNERPPRHLAPFVTFEAVPYIDTDATPFDIDEIDDLFVPPPPFYGVGRIGILNFYRVEQELSCYVLGEVSHIETVMAREYKERLSRDLKKVSQEFESEETAESTTKSDTATTTKNEMQSEVENSLQKQISHSVNVDASFGWESSQAIGGPNFNISSGYAYNNATTQNQSRKFAVDFATEVTERIEYSLLTKERTVRKSTVSHEFEQNNKHGFDNRDGSEHVLAVHRWLEKVFTNHLVNYGKRMVYEFCIPDPAINLRRAIQDKNEEDVFTLRKPKSLRRRGISKPKDLNENNYATLGSRYGVNIDPPPQDKRVISRTYSHSVDIYPTHAEEVRDPDYSVSETLDPISIPDGYNAARVTVPALSRISVGDHDYLIYVGNTFFGANRFGDWHNLPPGFDESLEVGLYSNNVSDVIFHVTVECQLKESIYRDWQLKAYNAMRDGYQQKLAQYNEKLAEHERTLKSSGEFNANTRTQENLMATELKRACIEMMVRPWGVQIGGNYYKNVDGFSELQLTRKLDLDCSYVKALENMFDWSLLTAIFYPYFYAKKSEWKKRMLNDGSGRQNFKAFMNAGWSRIEVPVRPGFEAAVTFFFQTGEVFLGKNIVTASDDSLYVSIADELAETEPVEIERSWQSKIPTSLTVLQSNAGALDLNGLPCETVDGRLAAGNSRLSPTPSPPASNDND